MLIENICLYIGSIIPQERPLAPIRPANAGSCPSRQRDCVATAARSAETKGTSQLVLRTQAGRKEREKKTLRESSESQARRSSAPQPPRCHECNEEALGHCPDCHRGLCQDHFPKQQDRKSTRLNSSHQI